MVVVLGEVAVLLEEAVALELEIVGLAEFDLEKGDLVEEPSVFAFGAEGALDVELFLDEFALDAGRRAAVGGVGGGFSIV